MKKEQKERIIDFIIDKSQEIYRSVDAYQVSISILCVKRVLIDIQIEVLKDKPFKPLLATYTDLLYDWINQEIPGPEYILDDILELECLISKF